MTMIHRFVAATAVIAAASLVVGADDTKGENLHIVIRAKNNLSQEQLENNLEDALDATASEMMLPKCYSKFKVKSITITDYNAYRRLADPDTPLEQLLSAKIPEKDPQIEIRELPASQPTWEFNLLGINPRELEKLDITFEGGDGKPISYTPKRIQEEKKDQPSTLSLTQLNSYAMRLEPGKKPKKFTAYVREFGDKGDAKPISGTWPEGSNIYLIQLTGFTGKRELLQENITNPSKVGNALDNFSIHNQVTLAIGDVARSVQGVPNGVIKGNILAVSVDKLPRQQPNAVYMLFPIPAEKYEAKLAELRKLPLTQLVEEIRKSPVKADKAAVITASSAPEWYELPLQLPQQPVQGLNAGTFGRHFFLGAQNEKMVTPKDYKDLLAKFPDAHHITVYLKDSNNRTRPVHYINDTKGAMDSPVNGGPMMDWSKKLPALAGEPAPKTP